MKIALPKPLLLALFIVFMVSAMLSGCLSREAEVTSSENTSISESTPISENASISESTSIIEDVNLEEAYALIVDNLSNPDFVIIDVRTPGEYASGHIEDAINMDFYAEDFDEQLDELDRDKIYLIYCQSGNLSGKARDKMEALGFKEVYNMLGGIANWERTNLPTVK
jgi:rhodanese-related sulfurtransferase